MKRATLSILALFAVLLFFASSYTIPETEQVILTQFGRQVGKPITNAGFHFKAPLIQHVNRIEKRVLEWDGPAAEMATRDKLYIIVEAFARWRIADPEQFFLRLRDERSGQSRLDDIIGSETRNTVARHDLVEVIRTSKTRTPAVDETFVGGKAAPGLPPIDFGRVVLEEEILKASKGKLAEFGIELLDVRLLRINYNMAVTSKIFDFAPRAGAKRPRFSASASVSCARSNRTPTARFRPSKAKRTPTRARFTPPPTTRHPTPASCTHSFAPSKRTRSPSTRTRP